MCFGQNVVVRKSAEARGRGETARDIVHTSRPSSGAWVGVMRYALCFVCLVFTASAVFAEPAKSSRTLERIRRIGVIHVGVKTDFAPFGMLNTRGESEGFEIDLAVDLARRLGVRLDKVSVSTENRYQKLEQGDVDVLISTSLCNNLKQHDPAGEVHYLVMDYCAGMAEGNPNIDRLIVIE